MKWVCWQIPCSKWVQPSVIHPQCLRESCFSVKSPLCTPSNPSFAKRDVIFVLPGNTNHLQIHIRKTSILIYGFSSGKLQKCGSCRYVYYCNRSCQREAWRNHKLECPCLLKVSPRIVPDAARMLSRIILKLNNGGEYEKSYYTDKLFRRFKDLMSRKNLRFGMFVMKN